MKKFGNEVIKLCLIVIAFIFLFIPMWKYCTSCTLPPSNENNSYIYIPLVQALSGIKNFLPIPLFVPILVVLIIHLTMQIFMFIKPKNRKSLVIIGYINTFLYLFTTIIFFGQYLYFIPIISLLLCSIFVTILFVKEKNYV